MNDFIAPSIEVFEISPMGSMHLSNGAHNPNVPE